MLRNFIVAAILTVISIVPANAQSAKAEWILVEALPTQDEALARILVYKTFLPAIAGYQTANGDFVVAVGPFSSLESKFLLTQFRQTGLIPADSFISSTDEFVRQFYPPSEASEVVADDLPKKTLPDTSVPVEPVAKPIGPDETAKEARNSERRLSLNEKKLLQVALKDAGHYTGAIDGLYGKGTRASMRRWQEANQYESTGILTTNQRSVLLDEYYVVLSDLGMRLVTDRAAGISIEMPTAVVAFDSYTAPFAHYTSIDDNLGEVHLISQPGDRAALYALYDVMETLSIVPLDGYRKKNRNNFILTGQSDNIISHTQAFLEGGQIKGFTIVWPANRADQADRLIDKMQGSFETNRSVLPRSSSTDIEPGQEMLAGLELRKATAIVSGAFINDAGMVLTTSDISESCERIAVLDETNYTVLSHAPELGLSLLAPKTRVTPIGFATIKASANRINARVAVAGYSFGGTLGSPTLTYGTIAATAGLQGETHLDRLKLAHFASDAGGPVLGSNGEIVGVLNARDTTSDRQLPSDVSFMTDNTALGSFLRQAGVSYTLNVALSNKSGIEIERMARDMSVWISCWE